MRISDWSSDVCSSDLLAALQPNGFRVAGNEKILAFHIVVQMRFNGMRVAHLLRIGPFAISEGEIRCFQDRCRRIEQGFVIFGDHHVANANQGGGLGGLVSHFYPLLVSIEMFRSCLMGAKESIFAMNCASA